MDTELPTTKEHLIGVINASSEFVKFSVFTWPSETEVASARENIPAISPQEGWAEQDPHEIMSAIISCVNEVVRNGFNMDISKLSTIGITNQRETTLVWDKYSGWPLYNAILWYDNRTSGIVDNVLSKFPEPDKDYLKSYCGLPVSTYFSALKLRWLIENVPAVKVAIKNHRCCFGTVDSWIVWSLTGGVDGGLHVTDVTNASRTMLMNIKTLKWDPILCRYFDIPMEILPTIKSSSEIYGYVKGTQLKATPISGILGNQQAGLVGERCLLKGQARGDYKTGCFLLYNTGYTCSFSSHGLITTVAYQMGKNEPPVYALEGSVSVAGLGLEWICSHLNLADDLQHAESIANLVDNTGDVYFVPAFYGLYAPYWRRDARGVICGLTQYTNKCHIIRAGIEAVCYQTKDILQAMRNDCQYPVTHLRIDGKLSDLDIVLQLQADITGIEVLRTGTRDVVSLGAATVAIQAEGIGIGQLCSLSPVPVLPNNIFYPRTTDSERTLRYKKWKMAIQRSIGWAYERKSRVMEDDRYMLLSSMPLTVFIAVAFGLLSITNRLQH